MRFHLTAISVLVLNYLSVALGQTSIKITSPQDGAVIRPGGTMTLRAEITGGAPKSVFVIGYDPIGLAGELKSPPFDFAVAIPKEINSGPYVLTATAATINEGLVDASVVIDVERSESPKELKN